MNESKFIITEEDKKESEILLQKNAYQKAFEITEKALLLACEKISFSEEEFESESEEEAQDNYLYKKYSRPKELMNYFIKKANEDGK